MDLLKYFSSTQQVQCKGVCAVSHSVNCHSQVTWLTDACHDSFTCDVTHSERAHAWVGTSRSKNISKKIGNPQGVAHIGVAWHGAVRWDVHVYIHTYIYTQTHVPNAHTLTQSHTYICTQILRTNTYINENKSLHIFWQDCPRALVLVERMYVCACWEHVYLCEWMCESIQHLGAAKIMILERWSSSTWAHWYIYTHAHMRVWEWWMCVYTTSWSGAQGCN